MMKSTQSLKNLINPAIIILLLNLLLSSGCSRSPTLSIGKIDIEKEFLDSFNKTTKLEYPAYANTKIVDKTFWIYIATQKELLTINSMSGIGGVMPEKIIKFLDIKCNYESSVFNLSYIFLKYNTEERTKERDLFRKSVGGSSLFQDFTDTTIEILQKTYYSIGDILSKSEEMNFFAICLADIKKGMEITFVIHRLDIEQFLLGMLPSDEFYNRMILKTDGSKEIINDRYGLHLKYNDISLVDFLREQIVNNARSVVSEMEKYEPQELLVLDELDDIILKSTYEVTTKYEFQDFVLVELENMLTKEKQMLSKLRLTQQFSESPSSLNSQESNYSEESNL